MLRLTDDFNAPGSPYDSHGSVQHIVLKSDGAVAWDSVDGNGNDVLWGTVRACQPETTLSQGILSGSLTSLLGNAIAWVDAGQMGAPDTPNTATLY